MSLLTPKNRKYRKEHVKAISGTASRGTQVSFGEFGLKAITSAYVTSRQLEAARKVIVRGTRKVGKLWFRVFPNVPLTKMGLEMPMGKGKGDVDQYAARVKR
jgi:large subunit ribosomal protein L16